MERGREGEGRGRNREGRREGGKIAAGVGSASWYTGLGHGVNDFRVVISVQVTRGENGGRKVDGEGMRHLSEGD